MKKKTPKKSNTYNIFKNHFLIILYYQLFRFFRTIIESNNASISTITNETVETTTLTATTTATTATKKLKITNEMKVDNNDYIILEKIDNNSKDNDDEQEEKPTEFEDNSKKWLKLRKEWTSRADTTPKGSLVSIDAGAALDDFLCARFVIVFAVYFVFLINKIRK